jgi:hypothetical protein
MMNWPYIACMVAASMLAITRRDVILTRCAAAVVGNWAVNTFYVTVSGEFTPWPLFIMTDMLAALVILKRPAAKMQALLGVSYLMQIAIHTGYAMVQAARGVPPDDVQMMYLDWLDIVGYGQLFILGTWGIGHGRGRRIAAFFHIGGGRRRSNPAHRKGHVE